MKRKYVARLILLGLLLMMGGCVYLMIKVIQGPDVRIQEGFFVHRKHEFRFKIPAGWILTKAPKGMDAKYILRKYGFRKTIDPADWFPALAINYDVGTFNEATAIRSAMANDMDTIKADSQSYRNLRILEKEIKKHPRLKNIGILSYRYTGIYQQQNQMTEKRYLVHGKLLVTFSLADFEDRFSNKVLDEIIESFCFE